MPAFLLARASTRSIAALSFGVRPSSASPFQPRSAQMASHVSAASSICSGSITRKASRTISMNCSCFMGPSDCPSEAGRNESKHRLKSSSLAIQDAAPLYPTTGYTERTHTTNRLLGREPLAHVRAIQLLLQFLQDSPISARYTGYRG